MYTSTDDREFQLQIFDGREYQPVSNGQRRDLEPVFESHPGIRRLVLACKNRPLKPRYCRPHGTLLPDAQDVVTRYFNWARANGLQSVAVYASPQRGVRYPSVPEHRIVAVSDFLGAAPAEEFDNQWE